MKAAVYHNYGSLEHLELVEMEIPVIKEDEVLVKVCAAAVNWHDWHFLMGSPFMVRIMAGLFKPKNQVLGIDAAGKVEAVGVKVEAFKPDDEVLGTTRHGCFAEYVSIPQEGLVKKPSNVTFEEAAAIPSSAFTALLALRDRGRVQTGQKVLINGASGGVGVYAVQIAKAMGAHVTGVCSAGHVELVRSLGADRVIDYIQEDFTKNGDQYDLIFDVAAKLSFSDCTRVLTPHGIYITSEFSPALALKGLWASITGSQKMASLLAKPPKNEDLFYIKALLESGQIKPVIERHYSLNEVPDALKHLSKGHTRGKVVILIQAGVTQSSKDLN